jgi:hypothetical protein
MNGSFAPFQKDEFASGAVATPISPIPPALASGLILKKGTADVTTFMELSWENTIGATNMDRRMPAALRVNFIELLFDDQITGVCPIIPLKAYSDKKFEVEVSLIGSFGCNLRFENKRNLLTNNRKQSFEIYRLFVSGAKINRNRLYQAIISIFFKTILHGLSFQNPTSYV